MSFRFSSFTQVIVAILSVGTPRVEVAISLGAGLRSVPMEDDDAILTEALAAIAAGTDNFLDLFEHCMETTALDEVAALLGTDPDDYLDELLRMCSLVWTVDDDRIVRLDFLADGLVLTHRLTADEVATGAIDMNPDLAIIDLEDIPLIVAGGTATREYDLGDDPRVSRDGSLVGPAGWLSAFPTGDMVAFRRVGRDGLVVEPAGDVAEGENELDAIAAAFTEETHGDDSIGADPEAVVIRALVDRPELFRRPVPPLVELFARAGLDVRGHWMGRAGREWKPPGVAIRDAFLQALRDRYQFNECCDRALDEVVDAWHSSVIADPFDTGAATRALGHGAVVEAFGDFIDRFHEMSNPTVAKFASKLIVPNRRDSAPALVLRARHHRVMCDAIAAERDLEEAVLIDPQYGPALVELAGFASARGDARRAVSLLRRAGVAEDDGMLSYLAGLGADYGRVGRNEPCPCGSGRKYKTCHLGKKQISDSDRVSWLQSKLGAFVTRSDRRSSLIGLASSAVLPDSEPDDLLRFAQDEFILELRMFEDGGVGEYLDERGDLLPPDERDALELWEMAELALWEVVTSDSAGRLTVRATKTGDTLEVIDGSMARDFHPGDQMLARFVPAFGKTWATGVVLHIDSRHRDSLLETLDLAVDANQIAQWYGRLHAPPRLTNREGDELVMTSAVLRPDTDWAELTTRLDTLFEPVEGEPGVWHEMLQIAPDERVVRSVLRREGEDLLVECNSEARLDRVLAYLTTTATVVSVDTRPLDEVVRRAWKASGSGEPDGERPDPAQPVMLDSATLEKLADQFEQRWLDESVPALGGSTPRQAAADPTRREDLIALLRSFDRMPAPPGAITMRPDVLRRHLGIEE